MSDETLWLTWSEIEKRAEGKTLVFFGRGEWLEKARPYVRGEGYIVDNSKYEQGNDESGLPIRHPSVLLEEDPGKLFVVITTTGFPEVTDQLKGYGLAVGVHFCVSPHLRGFGAITRMQQHQQRVYLTCSDPYICEGEDRGGGFYSLDIPSGNLKKIFSGVCHGVARGKDCLYVVDDELGIRVLEHDLTERAHFPLPTKSRPHGAAYCPKRNQIYVCQSGRDSIGVYDGTTYEPVDEIFISEKWETTGTPQHHINDPCVYGDSLYVGMFSFSGNWKIGVYDGGLMEIDLNTRAVRGPAVSDLWLPHTPTMINGTLWYCDSMRGKVHDTTWKVVTTFNGFVRGIASDGVFTYIGQSMHRYIERRRGTSDNISLDTGVFMLDVEAKTTRFFATPGITDINTVFVMSDSA